MLLSVAAVLAIIQQPSPPLAFVGFTAGMAIADARALIAKSGGSLTCKKTTDSRLKECTGALPIPGHSKPLSLLISSVRDSAGVIVVTGRMTEADTRRWVRSLTTDLGAPNHVLPRGGRESWQWVRRGQMLRVIAHKAGKALETAVTLTHGPLLDALGPPENKKPD